MPVRPHAIVAADAFLSDAWAVLGEDGLDELIWFLANNPHAGDLIPGAGGARKLRWTRPGMGKRGGARTIYYYAGENVPLFLIALYAKGKKSDLTQAERTYLRQHLPGWAERYKQGADDG